MSIEQTSEKIKPFYTLIVILLVALIFFGLGRLSALDSQKTPIKIQYPASSQVGSVLVGADIGSTKEEQVSLPVPEAAGTGGQVIGSKSGKKYYFPWCGTVKRIKPENQIIFSSIDEAKKAGFTAGGNCKGLK